MAPHGPQALDEGNVAWQLWHQMVAGACRFTGGGVDTLAVLDGSVLVGVPYFNGVLESGSQKTGRNNNESSINRYQFGGQAGANTGQQPQPKGDWTHHQQTGPAAGSFAFFQGCPRSR